MVDRMRSRAAIDEMRKSSGAGGLLERRVAACASGSHARPAFSACVHIGLMVVQLVRWKHGSRDDDYERSQWRPEQRALANSRDPIGTARVLGFTTHKRSENACEGC